MSEVEHRDDWVPADRPIDATPMHTTDLPDTPVRDRTIPATSWVEAPKAVITLGADFGYQVVAYKRRIGVYLLWRSGPASRGDARYMAINAGNLRERYTFRLFPDGSGEGDGPNGVTHDRFRAWKEALLAESKEREAKRTKSTTKKDGT
ncbi:MAG TPA: hypothetical protein VI916_12390 [Acidimicrobiia bacterium]|nr:hypothetical protein [Acidimicrobiia bacterium]